MPPPNVLRQELLDLAIEQEIITGCLLADGWAYVHLREKTIRLTEGQLLAFLYGAVGCRYYAGVPEQGTARTLPRPARRSAACLHSHAA